MEKKSDSNSLRISGIPLPTTAAPRTPLGSWFFQPEISNETFQPSHSSHTSDVSPWHRVLWLTGVDYFSTLGYQPGLALLAAGVLSPIATVILVLVTLFCALPTYHEVTKRSYAGQGSIAMIETLLKGWWSKFFVLILLGFAGTDFIITITLSAADAALHIAENPYFHNFLGQSQFTMTIVLITILGAVFMKGFNEAIGLASLIAIPYIGLNLVVIVAGLVEIGRHPDLIGKWQQAIISHGSWTQIILVSVLVFPKLALGMSGFETGVSVMPHVEGDNSDHTGIIPSGRIRNTQKLLTTAALIMSILLFLSSIVTSFIIPQSAYQSGGAANGRAIAYLAHTLLGNGFGTLYDISTILILWFAGASAIAGLLNLVPRYLPRFGMAPHWVAFRRPMVAVIYIIALIITWIFNADVEAQGGAYATGVLALMLSAAVAVALVFWKERSGKRRSLYFWGVAAVFAYTLSDNVIIRFDGVLVAGAFIITILLLGAISRWQRSLDLRVTDVIVEDKKSMDLWEKISNKKIHLVPLEHAKHEQRLRKASELRKHYRFDGHIAFIHIELIDNRSEFLSDLSISVQEDGSDYLITVKGASTIANTIAYVSELLNPISIYIGLTRSNLMSQSIRYLIFGEGETGLLVYRILLRYWEWTPEDDVRPLIFLMSE